MGMVALKCPQCGADVEMDETREFGFCTFCGTKVMQDKVVVEHKGSVKVDDSNELKNLYILARRARDEEDSDNAKKYYEELLLKDPNNWECVYYSAYFKAVGCKVGETGIVAMTLQNTTKSCFDLIKIQLDEQDQKSAYTEIANRNSVLGVLLYNSCEKLARLQSTSMTLDMSGVKMQYKAIDMIVATGDLLISVFQDTEKALEVYKIAYTPISDYPETFKDTFTTKTKVSLREKIKNLDPSFDAKAVANEKKQSNGCYVATAVYGSYDCPEVWTLRRYRDNQLAKTWHGRLFIHTYYAISPTLVKWFGNTQWFKNMWKPKLDKMVDRLQKDGVENTPYQDRNW